MPLAPDARDIVDVFVITNLDNLVTNNPNVNVPAGLQNFINASVVNNLDTLQFPSDIRQLLATFILDNLNETTT